MYFAVFACDLGTMILGKSRICDLNRSGVKDHPGVVWDHWPFAYSFWKMVTVSTYSDVFSSILDIMISG